MLSSFWEKAARIRWVASTDPVLAAHTYEEIIAESKGALLKYVSRDRAIIDLLHMPQGDKTRVSQSLWHRWKVRQHYAEWQRWP